MMCLSETVGLIASRMLMPKCDAVAQSYLQRLLVAEHAHLRANKLRCRSATLEEGDAMQTQSIRFTLTPLTLMARGSRAVARLVGQLVRIHLY